VLCEIKFFYEHTLRKEWPSLELVRPPKEKKLPVVLSIAEISQVLNCVHRLPYRACLGTIYSCGLCLWEGVYLQIADIDGDRSLIHVRNGKGGKERYVPLPEPTLAMLRQYWVTHRHPVMGVCAYNGHFGSLCRKDVFRNRPLYTPCATRGRHTCSKPGSILGLFRCVWDIAR
jgi:site-specific recombinase XerD